MDPTYLCTKKLAALSETMREERADSSSDTRLSRGARRAAGAFFTPLPLVKYVVKTSLDALFAGRSVRWNAVGHPEIRVLDPAAGDGRFLVAVVDYLLEKSRQLGLYPAMARQDQWAAIAGSCLVAIERDLSFANEIADRLGEEAEIHCAEALLSDCVQEGAFDLVIGNPPYMQAKKIENPLRTALQGRFAATSTGEWDLYAAFLEQGLGWLAPGGQLGFVLPSRWWSAAWAAPLRKCLSAEKKVWGLVDFGSQQLFTGATVYSSICFASLQCNETILVARRSNTQDAHWHRFSLANELLSDAAWPTQMARSASQRWASLAKGQSLGTVVRIAKGAGTSADSVYLVDSDKVEIETALLRPVLRGKDIRAYERHPNGPKLIVPYTGSGRLIEPSEMQARYPKAFAYLLASREILEAREGGRFKGRAFYAFGRPQNMRFLGDGAPKIVFPDISKEGRAMLDTHGAMVLDSAYTMRVLPKADWDLESLCGIMNSRVVSLWLRAVGIPLRGGYIRLKSSYLRDMPLPPQGEVRAISALVRDSATPETIDRRVQTAYGFSDEEWGI